MYEKIPVRDKDKNKYEGEDEYEDEYEYEDEDEVCFRVKFIVQHRLSQLINRCYPDHDTLLLQGSSVSPFGRHVTQPVHTHFVSETGL